MAEHLAGQVQTRAFPMMQPGSIQAVTFDVGGTLIDPWPSVGHVYSEVAAQHGFRDLDPEELNHRFGEAWRAKANFDYSRAAWSKIVATTFHGASGPAAEVSFFPDLYERFAAPEVWRVYDDVESTLGHLKQSEIKLAVISNWDERLRPLLRSLHLDRFFEVIIVSAELGEQKPSAAIFQKALQELHLPAQAVLHVGDSVCEDVEGARRAGLRAARVNRQRQSLAPGEIGSLAELVRLIAGHQY